MALQMSTFAEALLDFIVDDESPTAVWLDHLCCLTIINNGSDYSFECLFAQSFDYFFRKCYVNCIEDHLFNKCLMSQHLFLIQCLPPGCGIGSQRGPQFWQGPLRWPGRFPSSFFPHLFNGWQCLTCQTIVTVNREVLPLRTDCAQFLKGS